jgi:hypothetical protein
MRRCEMKTNHIHNIVNRGKMNQNNKSISSFEHALEYKSTEDWGQRGNQSVSKNPLI